MTRFHPLPLLFLFLLAIPNARSSTTSTVLEQAQRLYESVGVGVVASFDGTNGSQRVDMLKDFYKFMVLYDDGKFVVPELEAVSAILLESFDTDVVVSDIVKHCVNTTYLNFAMASIQDAVDANETFAFQARPQDEIDEALRQTTIFVLVLERVTEVMFADTDTYQAVLDYYTKLTAERNLIAYASNDFEKAKARGLDYSAASLLTAILEEHVKDEERRVLLQANIFEAVLQDQMALNGENARSGVTAMCAPASALKEEFEPTGAGPSIIANGLMESFPPFPETWADLYETWNLGFLVTHYANYPFLWAPLLPEIMVGNMDEHYLNYRIVTLYLFTKWILLSTEFAVKILQSGQPITPANSPVWVWMDWTDEKLPQIFGRANLHSAYQYQELLEADLDWTFWLQTCVRKSQVYLTQSVQDLTNTSTECFGVLSYLGETGSDQYQRTSDELFNDAVDFAMYTDVHADSIISDLSSSTMSSSSWWTGFLLLIICVHQIY